MRRAYPLKSLTFASGGRAIVELDQLPPDSRLKGILFTAPVQITNAGGTGAIIQPYTHNRLVDAVKLGKRINATGQLLDKLVWLMTGRDPSATLYVPAADGVYSRALALMLPFMDRDGYEPDDTSPACGMFRDQPIELSFGSTATLYPSANAVSIGTVQPIALVEKVKPGQLATPVVIDYADQAAEGRLPPGVYTHLGVCKEDGTALTSAEITEITVEVDGEPVIDRLTVPQLSAIFNAMKALGGEVFSAGASATIPGEAVEEHPGYAAAAGATVSVQFVPLLFPQLAGKLTKAWIAQNGIRVKWSGSLGTLRFFWRRVEPMSDAQVVKAAAKIGQVATNVRTRTASKAPITDSPTGRLLSAILPKQV